VLIPLRAAPIHSTRQGLAQRIVQTWLPVKGSGYILLAKRKVSIILELFMVPF
jgi:hypothetical protein